MRRTVLTVGLIAAAGASLAPWHAAADAGFNVIVSAKNGVTSLSKSDIKRLVTGNTKTWDNGAVVQLGIIPSDVPETQYLAALLDTSTRELMSTIQQQVFKGELRRPVVLRSSADCLALAAGNPGTICIAAADFPIPAGAKAVPVP
jgi:hypothetical protein